MIMATTLQIVTLRGQFQQSSIVLMLVFLLVACGNEPQQFVTPQASPESMLPTLSSERTGSEDLTADSLVTIDANWHNYTAPDNSYKARFPGRPIEETTTIDLDSGTTQLSLVTYEDTQQGKTYAISHNSIDTAVIDSSQTMEQHLADSQDGMAKAIAATVEIWEPINQQGHSGRLFTLRKPNSYAAKAKVFYANGTLYQAIVLVDNGNVDSLDVRAFLDSIQLPLQP